MNDHDIDALVAHAATVRTHDVAGLPVEAAAAELRERIVDDAAGAPTRQGPYLAAAAAVIAAFVLVAVAVVGRGGGGSAYAAEMVEVARSAPRLLVTADGWRVVRADEFTKHVGELTFSDGERQLDLHWRPASEHDGYVDDRGHSSGPPRAIRVAGRDGVLFRYTGTDDFTALWLDAEHSVELRGVAASEGDFLAVAATIRRVAVDAWLDAMPESVVEPDERAEVVAGMLQGIPLPPGWDVTELTGIDGVSDRYQLGARVAGAVACAWIDRWVDADAAGDPVAKARAAEAIASTRTWPILLEMVDDGDYPEVLWQYADVITLHDGYDPDVQRDRVRHGGYRDSACSPG